MQRTLLHRLPPTFPPNLSLVFRVVPPIPSNDFRESVTIRRRLVIGLAAVLMLVVLLWLILNTDFEPTAEKQASIDEASESSEQQPPNDSETLLAKSLSPTHPVSQDEAVSGTDTESEDRSIAESRSESFDADPMETARAVEKLMGQANQQNAQGNLRAMFDTLLQAYSLTQRYPDDKKLEELAGQLQSRIDAIGRRLDASQSTDLIDSSKKIIEQ